MDIRIKRTNRALFDCSPETCVILLEMFPDQIERLHFTSFQEKQAFKESLKPKPAEVKPEFFVGHDRIAGKYRIVMRCGAEEQFYVGPPVHAATAFGGGPRTVPEGVINEYKLLVGDGKPVDLLQELEKRRKANEQPAQPSWPQYK
jgi:hypothetical protein